MRRLVRAAIVAALGVVFLAAPAMGKAPAEIIHVDDLTQLVENARQLDGQTVMLSGEAFGDKMARKDGTWINVGDPASLIVGVIAPAETLQDVVHFGRHGMIGDRVTIVGEFHRACAAHGGDLDIHAMTVQVSTKGGPVSEPLKTVLVWWSAGLLIASCVLYLAHIKQTKRQQAS